jgi:hypothetical protein
LWREEEMIVFGIFTVFAVVMGYGHEGSSEEQYVTGAEGLADGGDLGVEEDITKLEFAGPPAGDDKEKSGGQ